ncbi:MAG: Ribose-phosphate pyrophosphokinase [Cenarchaeum symbiont of Oopsacas minuta]|nr:Ribose-phosphate pyrophosphokinase [Cenarchaeum symbiont of Oopsacas minuta]
MAKITVLAGSASVQIAKNLAVKLDASYVESLLRTFPDGESKLTADLRRVKGKIIVVQSMHPPVDTHLLHAVLLITKAKEITSEITAVIPYIGYARQDREFLDGEIVTIKAVAGMLRSAGAKRIITVDIHSKNALKKLGRGAINVSAIPILVARVKKMRLKNPLVVSPDMGGKNRAAEFAKILGTEYEALVKKRDRVTGKVHITTSEFDSILGRNVILVDDMISTGSSIVKAAKFLDSKGCGRILVVCTHALLVNGAEKKIKDAGVFGIISANTIPRSKSSVDVSEAIAQTVLNRSVRKVRNTRAL